MRLWSLAWRLGKVLWTSRLLKLSPQQLVLILQAWRTCGSSFAFLGAVAAIRFGSHLALQDEEGCLSFEQQWEQTQNWALFLQRQFDVRPGSQVAILCRNQRSFVLSLLAVTRLGGDVLPLGPDTPGPVLAKILKRQDISLVVHDSELTGLIEKWAPNLNHQVFTKAFPETTGGFTPVSRPGQLITLTSGSTGVAKGIRRRPTLGQVLPAMLGLLEALPFQLHRPFLLAIPLYHGYGVATLAVSLALGAPVHLARRYEISPLLSRSRSRQDGVLVTVPTLLLRWLKESVGTSECELTAIITGSAPLSAELSEAVIDRVGPILFNLYGSSEAGLISLAAPESLIAAPGTVGRPLPGNRIRILNSSDEAVEVGEVGRISVGGPLVLGGDEEGWRETGDLGRQDGYGNLHVCGRADTMLICGGENVFPHEVEAELRSHAEVIDSAILVVDDEEFSKRMLAAVVLETGSALTPIELKRWLRERMERHKIPKEVYLVKTIPQNALGKIDRVALAKLFSS